MEDQEPATQTNDAGSLGSLKALLWRSKWLIGAAAVVAGVVAFAIAQAGAIQVWSGRTTLTIGVAPTLAYLFFGETPVLDVIESQHAVVLRVSTPAFKAGMLKRAVFQPATAARSRSLVDSSLRAVALEGDPNVEIELSAASPQDVESALRAFEAEIGKAHEEILRRRMQILQEQIDQDRHRLEDIEKASDQLLDRVFKDADEKDRSRPALFELVPAWNQLKERIQRDTNLKEMTISTVLHLEPGTFLQGPRSIAVLGKSLLAGLGMLIAIVVLTLLVNVRPRVPKIP